MTDDEFLDQLDRLRDGDLSEHEVESLRAELKADPELRRQFVEEQLIAITLEEGPSQASPIPFPTPAARVSPHFPARGWAAAIVLFGIGLSTGWLLSQRPAFLVDSEPMDNGVAILSHAVDATWSGDLRPMDGSILGTGTVELSSGLAQIEFYSGARVVLEGPAELELLSAKEAILRSGKIRANVPPSARGFTIHSEQFELVDLGTEFGVEVGSDGVAEVQVFDGEVELYPPDGKRAPENLTRLLGGAGMAWSTDGSQKPILPREAEYTSFEEIQTRDHEVTQRRFSNWRHWSETTAQDPRVLVHYDFEGDGQRLLDRSASAFDGIIVGSERSGGRWPEKGALEFKRPGDRVRIDVPGEFDELTLAAWIRADATPNRHQSLLLTDEYRPGHLHWQIGPKRELRVGLKISKDGRERGTGYASSAIFGPRNIGTWTHVCTTYDRTRMTLRHFLDGQEVSEHPLIVDAPIQIGKGDIANWSVPIVHSQRPTPVRNFVGRIDEIVIWQDALTPVEVLDVYQKTRP